MIFWELLATIFSGFLLAGLVMPVKMFYKKTPKWLVPVAAGVGMLGFQVISEYSWYSHTVKKLPEGSVVVASVPKSTWFRPWSYAYPQVLQFVVLDGKNITVSTDSPSIKTVNLYFFERRMPAQTLAVQVDCANPNLTFEQAMQEKILTQVCP